MTKLCTSSHVKHPQTTISVLMLTLNCLVVSQELTRFFLVDVEAGELVARLSEIVAAKIAQLYGISASDPALYLAKHEGRWLAFDGLNHGIQEIQCTCLSRALRMDSMLLVRKCIEDAELPIPEPRQAKQVHVLVVLRSSPSDIHSVDHTILITSQDATNTTTIEPHTGTYASIVI